MRARLVAAFTMLAAICMIAFAIAVGYEVANSRTNKLLIERVHDANRFADLAAYDPATLCTAAQTFYDSTGSAVLVVARDGHALCVAGVDHTDAAVLTAIRDRHQLPTPRPLYPWNAQPILLAQPIGVDPQAGGVVVISVSTAVARSEILIRWTQLACGTLTALLIFSGVALLVSGWILRPVSGLLRDVDVLIATLPGPVPQPKAPPMDGPPEIVRLAVGVEAVTTAVAAYAAAERQHVVDTAHSLRNPLAAMMVRLQALQSEAMSDRDVGTFVSVVREVDRLAELLDALLPGTRDAEVAGGDAVVVAAERVDAWAEAFARRDMRLCFDPAVTEAHSAMPATALAQILDVTLSNATRYAGADTTTTVTVDRESESVVVRVADTGVGVSENEIDLLTTRFFRGTGSADGGSGLGLPIAATLAVQYGGLLFVESARPHGLVVTVTLPVAASDLTTR
ncbi:sensor histidine kinase [Nocardia sp. NPDC003979]